MAAFSLATVEGLTPIGEGHQGRVWSGWMDGQHVALKAVATSWRSLADLEAVHEVVASLVSGDPEVCRPVPIEGQFIVGFDDPTLGPSHLRAFAFADGYAFDKDNMTDVKSMGRTLSDCRPPA